MTDVPASMRAWVIRPDRLGEPRDAMRLETVDDARRRAGRGGRAGHGRRRELQQRLGLPRPARLGLPLHRRRLPHRRLRRLGHRRGGRAGRDALEARRRGRRALQPELRRVPGVQRPRPDGLLAAEDLGLRVQLGLVRRLLPRAGPAAAAEARAPDLGGGGVLRPRLLHRLPHARRPGGSRGGPQRARLGRGRRPRLDGDPALPPLRRERDRGRLERGQGRSLPAPRRARGHQPPRLRPHGRRRRSRTSTRSSASARPCARPPAVSTATSCSSTSARRRSSRACSCAARSARS